MHHRRSRRLSRFAAPLLAGALAIGTLAFVPATALAQSKDKKELTPPVPAPPRDTPGFLLGIGAGLVLGALVVGVNFIPSKRGHQD